MNINAVCYFCDAQATLYLLLGERAIVLCERHVRELKRELLDH